MSNAAADKRLVRSHSGLRIVPADPALRSPLSVDEPVWTPDNQCLSCQACSIKFDFLNRRHHCRRCGQCFCAKCCSLKLELPRMCFVDPVLHCARCGQISARENDFFNTHLKALQQGAQLSVGGSVFGEEPLQLSCKLSMDQRFLLFDNASGASPFVSYEPIELTRIKTIDLLSSSKESPGSAVPTSLEVSYTDTEEQGQKVHLSLVDPVSPLSPQRRQASAFLTALHKAKKLLAATPGSP